MSDYNELTGLLTELLTNRFSPKPEFIRGLLGDGQGNVVVPDRPDKNYVRFNRGSTEFFEVFNRTVTPVHDWPVLIGELPWQPGLTQVVDTDWAAFEQSGWGDSLGSTSPHAPTHEWPDGHPGSDPLNVYLRSLVPLRTYGDETNVYLNAYEYEYQSSGRVWGGLPGIDLGPVMASMITGTMRFMGIYLDPDLNLPGAVTGATTVFTSAFDPPRVEFPAGTLPSARVRVYGGQAEINEIDIKDVRQPFSVAGGGAGGWPFANILTVSQTDPDADYSTIQGAIVGANIGDNIWIDAGSYYEQVTINKAINISADPGSVLVYHDGVPGVVSDDAILSGIDFTNIGTTGTNYGLYVTADYPEFYNCRAAVQSATGSANSYGWYLDGTADARLWDCEGYAVGATGSNYGMYANLAGGDVARLYGGLYEGETGSLFIVTGTFYSSGPHLPNGVDGERSLSRGFYVGETNQQIDSFSTLAMNGRSILLDNGGNSIYAISNTTVLTIQYVTKLLLTSTQLTVNNDEEVTGNMTSKILFGEIVNGGYSDFATAQAAIDYAEANGYKHIYFPDGTYGSITISVNNITVEGAGLGTKFTDSSSHCITVNANGVTIKNLQCQGTAGGGNAYDCIHVNVSKSVVCIRGVYLSGSDRYGFYSDGSWVTMNNCVFYSANFDSNKVYLDTNSDDCVVVGNGNIDGDTVDNGAGNVIASNS